MMELSESENLFYTIAEKLAIENDHVQIGKMMSSPGLTYKNKVFAFYYKEQMGFRAGRELDLNEMGIIEWEQLNPYKNKPPMLDWYVVSFNESRYWIELAKISLNKLIK